MRAPLLTFKRARRLRRTMTRPEEILWSLLRGKQLDDLRFRRQHPVGPYILDFYCTSAKLCIEIDGPSHDSMPAAGHDARRTAWLNEQGISVLRFSAEQIEDSREQVRILDVIKAAAVGTDNPPP